MLSWIVAKLVGSVVARCVAAAVIVAIMAWGGYLYYNYHHLQTENAELKTQNAQLAADNKKMVEVMKNDIKVEAETQERKKRIDGLTPDELIDEWDRLREYKSGIEGGNPDSR
jgi:cell division protein FtsB